VAAFAKQAGSFEFLKGGNVRGAVILRSKYHGFSELNNRMTAPAIFQPLGIF